MMQAHTPEETDNDDGYAQITDEEYALAKQSAPNTSSIVSMVSDGFVYSAKTIAGCFAAVAIAPRALPYVLSYMGPSVATPGVALGTTTAVVGVVSYKVGSEIGNLGAESTLALASMAMNKTLTFVWGDKPNKVTSNKNKASEHKKKLKI